METIKNYFERITYNARVNEQFNLNWTSYTSRDFASTFLPHAKTHTGENVSCYDTAELFKSASTLPKGLADFKKELFSVSLFTYPSVAEAKNKIKTIQLQDKELCCFIEIDQQNEIAMSFRFGSSMRQFLNSILKTDKVNNDASFYEQQVFQTDSVSLIKMLDETISYETLIPFIIETLGLTHKTSMSYSFDEADKRIEEAYKTVFDGVLFEAGYVKSKSPESWAHGDIEKVALGANGYKDHEIEKVYFGNWLRDYSSL